MPLIPKRGLEKNMFKLTFNTLGNVVVLLPVGVVEGAPVTDGLVNTFIRVFAVAITWVNPTSPQLSGGVYGDSLPDTFANEPHIARKLLFTVCVGAEVGVVLLFILFDVINVPNLDTGFAAGFCPFGVGPSNSGLNRIL